MTAADGDPRPDPHIPEEWTPADLPPPVAPPVPGYDYGPPPVRSGIHPVAVAAMASSIAGFLPYFGGVLSIVGIVLGTVALNQIKQAPQNGYGLAVSAIVVGVTALIIGLIWTIYAMR
ncbi:hypothetical protein MCHIJ_26890 [Mycolicibacterium chitae]|uniref:Membrane protein n=1 Tax=Mycolicibacterium chitae TaxID=1792 RepID=A0A448I2J4_MYCCI|nr:DUF4190 domain-containing protein [Mycolicibacterium chitae]MCV7105519.1 DUF4190 domain-containing protein [Mycolicibacterium chitae]BBZ03252.1 hypothetical protein MCHIJ_26890 [Mycolicibacterium chitae]VEG46612.1 membrane protein [Mycolicibacterium chitae]